MELTEFSGTLIWIVEERFKFGQLIGTDLIAETVAPSTRPY